MLPSPHTHPRFHSGAVLGAFVLQALVTAGGGCPRERIPSLRRTSDAGRSCRGGAGFGGPGMDGRGTVSLFRGAPGPPPLSGTHRISVWAPGTEVRFEKPLAFNFSVRLPMTLAVLRTRDVGRHGTPSTGGARPHGADRGRGRRGDRRAVARPEQPLRRVRGPARARDVRLAFEAAPCLGLPSPHGDPPGRRHRPRSEGRLGRGFTRRSRISSTVTVH